MFIVCFRFSFEYFCVHQPKLRVIFACAAVECGLPYYVHVTDTASNIMSVSKNEVS